MRTHQSCWPTLTRTCFQILPTRSNHHSVVNSLAARSVVPLRRTKPSSSVLSSTRVSAATQLSRAPIKFLEPFGYKSVQFLPQPFNDWQYTVKGDFNLNHKHTLVTRFAGQNNNALN